ncbi:xylulokinase [Spirochaetia bacterium]|nr:xylulokinase [Spirochaetia bacterium]
MLLVIDIGTSTFKAALVNYDGTWDKTAAIPMTMGKSDGLRHEADPGQWLRAFGDALSQLGSLARVEALVISGNGPTLAPVTGEPGLAKGELVLPADTARLWLDRRATEEARAVSAVAGAYVDPSFFLPKALAVKNQEPALYGRTRLFLSTAEYLAYALTGEARSVFPSAGFERWYWDDAVLDALGLDKEKFPPFIFPGECIGTVSVAVAARFGFSSSVRVIAGGPDFFVSILGTGTVSPGQACDRSGTSEGINVCTQERISDPRLMSYGHPVKPFWNLSGIISTSGKAISWGREILGVADKPHAAFYKLAATAPAGSGGVVFLPYLAGERAPIWDSKIRGVFSGLNLSTGQEALARSIAEGVCFAIRDVITVMEEVGAPVKELRVTGGPAESEFLNQLKADVSGRPVLLARRDAELLGLAVLGAVAQGKYGSAGEAAGALVRIERVFTPDRGKKQGYDTIFEVYRGLYRALKSE